MFGESAKMTAQDRRCVSARSGIASPRPSHWPRIWRIVGQDREAVFSMRSTPALSPDDVSDPPTVD